MAIDGRVVACAVALAATVGVAPKAVASHAVGGFFGENPSGVGGGAGQTIIPRDVAVLVGTDGDRATDKLFVLEGGAAGQRVQRFDHHGNFELMWGRDVVAGNATTGYEICTAAQATSCQHGAAGAGSTGVAAGEFDDPQAIAVDQDSGLVYVADRDNRRIQVFDSNGEFKRMWGFDVVAGGGASFEVCDIEAGDAIGQCKNGVAGAGTGQFGSGSTANAYDVVVSPPDGSAASGKVFLANTNNRRVETYDLDGGNPASIGSAADFDTDQPRKLAVDSDGILYASDAQRSGEVERYDLEGDVHPSTDPGFLAPILATNSLDGLAPDDGPLLAGSGAPGGSAPAATSGLETDPSSGALYVLRDPASGETAVQEVADAGLVAAPSTATAHGGGVGLGAVNGLGYDPAADYFHVAAFFGNPPAPGFGVLVLAEGVDVFDASDVELGTVSGIGPTAATLTARIDPGGGLVSYRFEISADGVDFTPVGGLRFLSGGEDDVSVVASDLEPNKTYRFRLVASRRSALTTTQSVTTASGVLLTPPDAPTVETVGASERTDTQATLAGRVNPNNSETRYWFEYGTTTAYGSTAPAVPALLGAERVTRLVAERVGGLLPDTVYNFRIVADGFGSPVAGANRTFRTDTSAAPIPAPARAFELVSPPDKLSGTGVGSWYGGLPEAGYVGVAALEGDRFRLDGKLGSVLLDSAFSFAADAALAERRDDAVGWQSHSPITRGGHGGQVYRQLGGVTANDDLSRMVWSSSGLLRLFPEMETWPDEGAVFLSDWGRPPAAPTRWELFGPTDVDQIVTSGGNLFGTESVAVSRDGRFAVAPSRLRGLAGSGDPTHRDWPDGFVAAASSVYMLDVSSGLSDAFPAADDTRRKLVNVCTGEPGVDRTLIPDRAGAKQAVQECPAALSGRDDALVSSRGASLMRGAASERSISEDGARVVFMAPDPAVADPDGAGPLTGGLDPCSTHPSAVGPATSCPAQVYLRQRNATGATVRWLSRSEVANQDVSLMGPALLESASRDGGRVLFRTSSPLTVDDPNATGAAPVTTGDASSQSWDLYMYATGGGADPTAGGELTRVSAGPTGSGDCNVSADGSRPAVRYASDDGARVYFLCEEPLAGVPAPGSGTTTSPGSGPDAVNLYLYERSATGSESWRFVARLPRTSALGDCATRGTNHGGALVGASGSKEVLVNSGYNCVHGTPDGSLITWFTDGSLTADDSQPETGDVYAYDALADELTRVTAPQGGGGGSYGCTVDPDGVPRPAPRCFGDGGISPGIALPRLGVAGDATRPAERSVFFQSRSRLVVEDGDELYDVYQWRDGDLSLVSNGFSDHEGALYVGNDRSGTNVYMATRDRLTWQDHDEVLDVYVARAGSDGIPQPAEPPLCEVLAHRCRGDGAAPIAAVMRSESGGGDANPGRRARLAIRKVGKRARRAAARRGVLRLRVRASKAGMLVVRARATIGRRSVQVGRVRRRVTTPGPTTVTLRLSRAARRALDRGRALRVIVSAAQPGVSMRTAVVRLERGDKS